MDISVNVQRDHLELFSDSLDRCIANPRFLDRFYFLFTADPEVAEKFRRTDFGRQKNMLKVSLYMIISMVNVPLEGNNHWERIAESHSQKRLNIEPKHYDRWVECLTLAASECDEEYNEHVELAWQKVLARGVEFMKSRY